MAEALPLADLVTCAICQEVYVEPLALPCLHTLCTECVKTLKKRSRISNCIQCPLCRERSDTRELKHDFRIKSLVEIYQSRHKLERELSVETDVSLCCQLCRKKAFTGKCVDCNKLICDGCQATHNSIPMCESHCVVSLPDLLSDCGLRIGQINGTLQQDRKSLALKLHTLIDYLNDLEKVKQEMISSLDSSEEAVLAKVKQHYSNLRQKVDNEINTYKCTAEESKSQILKVMNKIIQRSQLVVDALSGADISSVLTNIGNLKDESVSLDTEQYLQLPKAQLSLVERPEAWPPELSSIVDIRSVELSDCDLFADHVDSASALISVVEILQEASNLGDTEKSGVHYNFQYCDQVCVMLNKLQENLNTFKENSSQAGALKTSHCMISPTSIDVFATTNSWNSDEIVTGVETKPIPLRCESLLSKYEEPQSLRIIDSEIWCIYQDHVLVYDHNLALKNKLMRPQLGVRGEFLNMRSIVKADSGHYFQACDSRGLQMLSPNRSGVFIAYKGTIADVNAEGNTLIALDSKDDLILIFKYGDSEYHSFSNSPWKLFLSFKSQSPLSIDDTMAVVDDVVVVCSYRNDALYRYALDGTHLATVQSSPSRKGPGHLWRPRICHKTNDGSLLIADHYHNRLQLLSPSGFWRVLKFERDLNFPWDAVLSDNCGLVVLEKCNWKHKLVQFRET